MPYLSSASSGPVWAGALTTKRCPKADRLAERFLCDKPQSCNELSFVLECCMPMGNRTRCDLLATHTPNLASHV
jgi:hypothetical protein